MTQNLLMRLATLIDKKKGKVQYSNHERKILSRLEIGKFYLIY